MKFISLKNYSGMEIVLCNIGAGLVSIKVPDKKGVVERVLAQPEGKDYPYAGGCFGKTCGRTAGRIADGKFTLNGVDYTIKSRMPQALHGGDKGFAYRRFKYSLEETATEKIAIFTLVSKDMEGGYPGKLDVKVIYALSKTENSLEITFETISDKDTLCNLTNHAYFNLSGDVKGSVNDQELFINASKYGVVDEVMLPSVFADVNEHFDFRKPHAIGKYIKEKDVVLNTNGYDHPFMFDKTDYSIPQAILLDPLSGRKMTIYTTYDSVVCYTCNYPGKTLLPNGNYLKQNDAVCLEMQHFPNGVNSNFLSEPKDVLKANQRSINKTKLVFSVE